MFLLRILKASVKRDSMFPACRLSRREEIMGAMLVLSRFCLEVGARMSSLRWTSSHQKGEDKSVDGDLMIVSIILEWIVKKRRLLLPVRKCRQVVLKGGGSWS